MPSTLELSPDAAVSSSGIDHGHPLKPLLRGWSHVVGFVAVLVLGIVRIVTADATSWQRATLIVYVAGTLAMLGVSSLYHRLGWTTVGRARMRRLDHSTIFLAIAGAYTPVMATATHGWQRPTVLVVAWVGAAIGIALQWLPVEVPRALFTGVYVLVGWCAALAFPQLVHGLGGVGFGLLLGGGIAYTLGAVVYAAKWPDPWPNVFGYHEVFHLFTIIGAGCHLATIAFAVVPRF
jgi:hemolysin III